MEPIAFEESPQLSSEISLNLDDETSEKTSCWQKFRSLKRKYHCILITTLLVIVASIASGATIGFSAQSGRYIVVGRLEVSFCYVSHCEGYSGGVLITLWAKIYDRLFLSLKM